MPIIHQCTDPDCPILTMGDLCLEHEHADPATRLGSRVSGATVGDHEAPGEA
jgi:hypothetical protein